jgi:hypothetical protein
MRFDLLTDKHRPTAEGVQSEYGARGTGSRGHANARARVPAPEVGGVIASAVWVRCARSLKPELVRLERNAGVCVCVRVCVWRYNVEGGLRVHS